MWLYGTPLFVKFKIILRDFLNSELQGNTFSCICPLFVTIIVTNCFEGYVIMLL